MPVHALYDVIDSWRGIHEGDTAYFHLGRVDAVTRLFSSVGSVERDQDGIAGRGRHPGSRGA